LQLLLKKEFNVALFNLRKSVCHSSFMPRSDPEIKKTSKLLNISIMKMISIHLILSFLIFNLAFLNSAIAQSNIKRILFTDHRTHASVKSYQVFKIDTMKPCLLDLRFERANMQEGVVGNDFYGEQKIGFAKGKNSWHDFTDYQPIDSYKRTLCGKVTEYAFHGGREDRSGYSVDIPVVGNIELDVDDDLQIYIKADENNSRLQQNKNRILDLLDNNGEKAWNFIEGELDIHQSHKINYIPSSGFGIYVRTPIVNQTSACLYGAWVVEVAGRLNDGHDNNHEIHPAEQFWWRDKSNDATFYNLVLAVDNSGKFNDRGDFYSQTITANGIENSLVEPWGKSPLDGTFAIPFTVNTGLKEKAIFSISGKSARSVKTKVDDGRMHFLIYRKDTLAFVNETNFDELVNIEFENVGYSNSSNSLVTGFLVIKSRIDKTFGSVLGKKVEVDYAGNLKLEVKQVITTKPVKRHALVKLLSITRLENNSYRGINPNTNHTITQFSPNPNPSNFNEKKLIVKLRKGEGSLSIPINSLDIGQTFNFNNVSFAWGGLITDSYSLSVNCQTNDEYNFPLGELTIAGFLDQTEEENRIAKTLLYSEVSTIQNEVNLFELHFTVYH